MKPSGHRQRSPRGNRKTGRGSLLAGFASAALERHRHPTLSRKGSKPAEAVSSKRRIWHANLLARDTGQKQLNVPKPQNSASAVAESCPGICRDGRCQILSNGTEVNMLLDKQPGVKHNGTGMNTPPPSPVYQIMPWPGLFKLLPSNPAPVTLHVRTTGATIWYHLIRGQWVRYSGFIEHGNTPNRPLEVGGHGREGIVPLPPPPTANPGLSTPYPRQSPSGGPTPFLTQ